jgi:hypothetical protein
MFLAIALASLLTASPAQALPSSPAPGQVLLRCNISSGPDQEVTVHRTVEGLFLHELTTSGRRLNRALSQTEWDSRRLRLRAEFPGEENVLTGEKGAWTFLGQGAGVNIVVLADCW